MPIRRVLPVYIATVCFFSAYSARNLLVPLRAHELGAGRSEVGLILGVSLLTAALLSIPSGYLVDRLGRRPTVLVAILLGLAAHLGLAAAGDPVVFYPMQAVTGLAAGMAQAGITASLIDVAGPAMVGRAMGGFTFCLQIGLLSGPALAGLLLQFTDLRADLYITALLNVATLVAAWTIPNTRHRPLAVGAGGLGSALAIMRAPAFYPAALGTLSGSIGFGVVTGYLPLFAKESLLLPAAQIGYLMSLVAVANAATRIPAGRLSDRIQTTALPIAVGMTIFAVAMFVLPHTAGLLAPAGILALASPANAVAFMAAAVAFGRLGAIGGRGLAMGMSSTFVYVGLGLGPAALGPVFQGYGYTAGFSVAAGVSIGLAVLGLLIHLATRRAGSPAV